MTNDWEGAFESLLGDRPFKPTGLRTLIGPGTEPGGGQLTQTIVSKARIRLVLLSFSGATVPGKEARMALIKCLECGREVSDNATTCPSCAYPLAQKRHGRQLVVVIERTSKQWKGLKLIGVSLIILGLIAFCFGLGGESELPVAVGGLVALAGFGCLWSARIGAWWYHG